MSPLASLLFKGLATKLTSVKWTIVVSAKLKCSFIFPVIFSFQVKIFSAFELSIPIDESLLKEIPASSQF